jgi:hypothetical protein
MNRVLWTALLGIALSGCVVAPVPGVYVPPGVAYVHPGYPAPGPEYVWSYDVAIGWGWRHPTLGWHRR